MIAIDLQVRTVSPDNSVWRLFPGAGYRFLDSFMDDGIGYLDFPGLTLPTGKPLDKVANLIPLIALSAAYKERLPSEPDAKNIVLREKDFANAKHTQSRGRLRQALINFYQTAKSGDLVVLPEPLYTRDVWIGEFVGSTVRYSPYYRRPFDVTVPSRKIRWLSKVKENSLSPILSEALRHQHPFTLVERSRFLEIMSLAYSSFIFKDHHVATIYNGDDFLNTDSSFIGNLSKLAAAGCLAHDSNKSGLGNDLLDILLGDQEIDYTCSQESDIHSPGFTRLIGGSLVAIVTVALLVSLIELSKTNSKTQIQQSILAAEFINTSPDADPACTAKVSQISKNILLSIGIDKTMKLCKSAREAADRAKLRSTAKPFK